VSTRCSVALLHPLKEWSLQESRPIRREAHGRVVGGAVYGREDDKAFSARAVFDGKAIRDGVRTLFEWRLKGSETPGIRLNSGLSPISVHR
jgi:hypothetical protein